jgi:hypothetical protein
LPLARGGRLMQTCRSRPLLGIQQKMIPRPYRESAGCPVMPSWRRVSVVRCGPCVVRSSGLAGIRGAEASAAGRRPRSAPVVRAVLGGGPGDVRPCGEDVATMIGRRRHLGSIMLVKALAMAATWTRCCRPRGWAMAIIRVIRDHPTYRHPWVAWQVYVDDELMGSLRNGQHMDCPVRIGDHRVHIEIYGSDPASNRLLCTNQGDDIVNVLARPGGPVLRGLLGEPAFVNLTVVSVTDDR